jgi:hypothetical protein
MAGYYTQYPAILQQSLATLFPFLENLKDHLTLFPFLENRFLERRG